MKYKIIAFNLFMITLIVLAWIYSGDNFSNVMATFCGLFSMFTGSAMIYDRELEWEKRKKQQSQKLKEQLKELNKKLKNLEDKYNGDK